MNAEMPPDGYTKSYCCEELKLVMELEGENCSAMDDGTDGIPEVINDFLNLRVCPFCGASLVD